MAAVTEEIARADLSGCSRDERLAFYLNAYNLLVIHQVLDRLRDRPTWPGVVTAVEKLRFFAMRRHHVAGQKCSLMALENRVLRRDFAEPRIHFALNCASRSCPPLPRRLFTGASLEQDLERCTGNFLRSNAVREVAHSKGTDLEVSAIFRWYRRDFPPSVLAFIGSYRDVPDNARLRFQSYDWRLNHCRKPGSQGPLYQPL